MTDDTPAPREGRNLEPSRRPGTDTPGNREPGTSQHPNASKPRRDLEQRAAREEQATEDGAHLFGERALDGHRHERRYFAGDDRADD